MLVRVGSIGIPSAIVAEESWIGEIMNRIDGLVLHDAITGVLMLSRVELIHIAGVLVFMGFRQDNGKGNDKNQNSQDQENKAAEDYNPSSREGSCNESGERSFFLSTFDILWLF